MEANVLEKNPQLSKHINNNSEIIFGLNIIYYSVHSKVFTLV